MVISIRKVWLKFLWIIQVLVLLFMSSNLLNFSYVLAQESANNEINLRFPVVTKDGQDDRTSLISTNRWEYTEGLGIADEIRYSWKNAVLDKKFQNSPASGAGYLEVFLDDDTDPDNLLFTYGSSPLPVSLLKDFIEPGENQLLFRYINSKGNVGSKVVFLFDYLPDESDPNIEVVKPRTGAILTDDVNYDVTLNISNFTLESINSNKKDRGQLRVYINSIKPENLLETFTFSQVLDSKTNQVNFNTKDINLSNKKIDDSQNSKLVFVLTRTNGDLLPYRTELPVITNFQNSLDVGLPKISFVDPDKERTDLEVDKNRKFSLQIDNFEILSAFESGDNQPDEGYLQIFIDNVPVSTLYPNKEFSLNEIGVNNLPEGRHTVGVQLVNKDFTLLEPVAKDEVEIVYVADSKDEEDLNIQSQNWRIYAILGIVILVLGFVVWFVIRS